MPWLLLNERSPVPVKGVDGKELDHPQSPFGTIEYRDNGLAYGRGEV